MGRTIEMDIEPQFKVRDRVRVVTCDTEFFGCVGVVESVHKGEFLLGTTHYFVRVDGLSIPLLFREMQLAFSQTKENL